MAKAQPLDRAGPETGIANELLGVVVPVFGVGRTNQAEKAVVFVGQAGGEEQVIFPAGGAAVCEFESPQSVNGHGLAERVLYRTL